jgi:hypothetical protein
MSNNSVVPPSAKHDPTGRADFFPAPLVREKIFLDQCVGSETTQLLLEGDIIVPDIKPDMALLLQTDAKVIIDRTEVSADRVNFMGRLNISVLYMGKASDKPVHAMNQSAAVDDFINMDGVTKDMWVFAKADIANIEYKMLNDRKVNYRAIVNVSIKAERSDVHEMVVHIHDVPENQQPKTHLHINRTIEHKSERFSVKDQILLPSGKPNIREVLSCTTAIANRDVRIVSGRVNLTGELTITTLYKGDTDDSLIEFVENEIPFNAPIDVQNARDDMFADVTLQVLDNYVQVRPDTDGEDRVLELEVSIGVQMKVYSAESLQILEDAYIINKTLNFSRVPVHYPRLVCRNRNQAPIKEVVQLSGCPDMLQIFRVKGSPQIDEIKTIEDKCIVEGIIDTDILYVAENDETPLYCYKTVIPYRQVIEAKGANPQMTVHVDISIDHIAFNMLSGWETEVRFLLTFNTQVTEEKQTEVINHIEFTDMDPALLNNMASMTVYVVQPGDTLWKIAKKYNTAIDELLAVNEIEHPSKIAAGQKLLILKVV